MSEQAAKDQESQIGKYQIAIVGMALLILLQGAFVYLLNREWAVRLHNMDTIDRHIQDEMAKDISDLQWKVIQQQHEVEAYEAEQERHKIDDAKKKAKADTIRNEVSCLADNIYHEAAYEPENGQLAVATVTMNRVADPNYPKSVCGVVYERHIKKNSDKIVCMFSWTCKPRYAIHPSIYQKILAMAKQVYFKHVRNDEVQDAVLYHAAYIKTPDWADPQNLVATIGQHLFYKQ